MTGDMRSGRCANCGTYWSHNANRNLHVLNHLCPNCVGRLPTLTWDCDLIGKARNLIRGRITTLTGRGPQ